jgi:hypothetical protein
VTGYRRTLVHGIEDEDERYPGTVNDTCITRVHTPWYPSAQYTPAGNSWVNWTAAGPTRPELHMHTLNFRVMQGTSRTRNLQDPRPDSTYRQTAPGYRSTPEGIVQPSHAIPVGLHTDPKMYGSHNVARFVTSGLPQMTTARQDRLRSGQYTGQNYSQTTRIQGG